MLTCEPIQCSPEREDLPDPNSKDSKTSPNSRAAGFTLIELSIVLLIIAVVASIAIPKLRSISGVELKAAARRLSNTTRVLFDEASMRGTVYALNLDLDEQAYWVLKLDLASGAFVEDGQVLTRRVEMPQDVRISDVVLPGVGKIVSGNGPIRFYPEGYADRAVIHLVDVNDSAFTLAIDPVHGGAEVREGYFDLEARS